MNNVIEQGDLNFQSRSAVPDNRQQRQPCYRTAPERRCFTPYLPSASRLSTGMPRKEMSAADMLSIRMAALLVHCTRVCMEDSRSGNSDSYCQNSNVLFFLRIFFSSANDKTVEVGAFGRGFFVYFHSSLIRVLLGASPPPFRLKGDNISACLGKRLGFFFKIAMMVTIITRYVLLGHPKIHSADWY